MSKYGDKLEVAAKVAQKRYEATMTDYSVPWKDCTPAYRLAATRDALVNPEPKGEEYFDVLIANVGAAKRDLSVRDRIEIIDILKKAKAAR